MTLAVYVHFPWCLQKCPYCDFATEAIAPRDLDHVGYADAVVSEVAMRRADFGTRGVDTVFFGGGTPSLWEPRQLGRVLDAIVKAFGGAPREVTVECNPTSLTAERARALRDVGVGRVSIGVQSLRDPHLRYLGRLHDAEGAVRAVGTAVEIAPRVSADLMFGMHEQRVDELIGDVDRLLALGIGHVSAYSLTIEPATRFGELARKGRLPKLADDAVAEMYTALESRFGAAGFAHYEVSNYARAGEASLHNAAYWRGVPYVGLGAAAVGCFERGTGDRVRYRNAPDPRAYVRALAEGALPPDERETLDAETIVREGLMLGLRTDEGVDLAAVASQSGRDPRAGREAAIARAVARGNVIDTGDRLRIPHARWLLADGIVAALF